jgi:hypothetical protein
MSAQDLINKLREIERNIYQGVRRGMVAEGEAIMKRSKDEFAPKDKGDLIASGKVTLIEDGTVEGLKVVLSYGNQSTGVYPLVVHETPSGYDPPTWEGKEVQFTQGGPQYLSRPLFEAENGMIERIASEVRL